MTRLAISATAFALTAGVPTDARSLLHVDGGCPCPEGTRTSIRPHRGGRRLLVAVEPLEPCPRGYELATLALTVLRESFAAATSLDPARALAHAFAAANGALLDENRPLPGCRWDRRVYVGATAIVLANRSVTIAQVPPTQALLVQDRRLYAFPDLASWRADFLPATDQPDPDPLGWRDATRPRLWSTVAGPGDLILLCSSPLARCLGREAGAAWSEWLLAGDPDRALEGVAEIAVERDLDEVLVAAVALDRTPVTIGGGRALRTGLGRLGAGLAALTPRLPAASPPQPRPVAPLATHGLAAPARPGFAAGCLPGAIGRRSWADVGIPLDRPLAAVSAAAAAPSAAARVPPRPAPSAARRQVVPPGMTGRSRPVAGAARPRSVSPALRAQALLIGLTERLLSGRRAAVVTLATRRQARLTPGIRNMRRYRSAPAVPAEWRAQLPRGLEPNVSGRMMTVALAGFLIFGGSGVAVDQQRQRAAHAQDTLSQVDAALALLAPSGEHPVASQDALARAERALEEARAAGVAAAALVARQRSLDEVRDRAWSISRLAAMTRLGALPEEMRGQPLRLVVAEGDLFLVGGGLFQLDGESGRLVRLLAPGEAVSGGRVGSLHDAAVTDAGLLVTDGAAFYARGAAGRWARRPIFPAETGGAWPPLGLAAFDDRTYALTEDGRILQFAPDDPAPPRTWADAAPHRGGQPARDLAIAGGLHVLLADGRLLTFSRGELRERLSPAVSPPLVAPVVLTAGLESGSLYLLDTGVAIGETGGRIVRLDGDGDFRQFLSPAPADGDPAGELAARALGNARDIAVDEAAGVVYVVTDRDLWRATLPIEPGVS